LGARDEGTYPYEGLEDELRVYTGLPTQEKIDFLYNHPSGSYGEELAADVIFSEALSATVKISETLAADVVMTETASSEEVL